MELNYERGQADIDAPPPRLTTLSSISRPGTNPGIAEIADNSCASACVRDRAGASSASLGGGSMKMPSLHSIAAPLSVSLASVQLFRDETASSISGVSLQSRLSVVRAFARRPFNWTRDDGVEGCVVLGTHMAYVRQRSFMRSSNGTTAWAKRFTGALTIAAHAANLGVAPDYCGVYTGATRLRTCTRGNEVFAYIEKRELNARAQLRLVSRSARAKFDAWDGLGSRGPDLPTICVAQTGSLITLADEFSCPRAPVLLLPMAAPTQLRRLLVVERSGSGSFRLRNIAGDSARSIDEAFLDACCAFEMLLDLGVTASERIILDVSNPNIHAPFRLHCLPDDGAKRGFHVGGACDVIV